MKRSLLPFVALGAILLVVAALMLLMQPGGNAPPANLPEAAPVDPLKAEMNCVDRVLQNRNMRAEEVEPALARCRASAGTAELNSSR